MIAAAARKLTSTMPSAIAALPRRPSRRTSPATSTIDGRDHETALDDVERDLALDERATGCCSHGLPSSSRVDLGLVRSSRLRDAEPDDGEQAEDDGEQRAGAEAAVDPEAEQHEDQRRGDDLERLRRTRSRTRATCLAGRDAPLPEPRRSPFWITSVGPPPPLPEGACESIRNLWCGAKNESNRSDNSDDRVAETHAPVGSAAASCSRSTTSSAGRAPVGCGPVRGARGATRIPGGTTRAASSASAATTNGTSALLLLREVGRHERDARQQRRPRPEDDDGPARPVTEAHQAVMEVPGVGLMPALAMRPCAGGTRTPCRGSARRGSAPGSASGPKKKNVFPENA